MRSHPKLDCQFPSTHVKLNRIENPFLLAGRYNQGSSVRITRETKGLPEAEAAGASMLAERVDRLFRTIHPRNRGEYSFEEVAEAIRARGGPTVSATYLWQLRKGLRDNPTKKHLEALADFF